MNDRFDFLQKERKRAIVKIIAKRFDSGKLLHSAFIAIVLIAHVCTCAVSCAIQTDASR